MPDRRHRLMIDGFGGQGILSVGKYLATVAVESGREVAFVPSYGAEVRGGTAHCDIVMSRQLVLSPRIEVPTGMLLFCQESFDRFIPLAGAGCDVVVNASLVKANGYAGPGYLVEVDAHALAAKVDNPRAVNMVMAGAWLGLTGALPMETARHVVKEISPPKLQQFVQSNIAALDIGFQAGLDAAPSA